MLVVFVFPQAAWLFSLTALLAWRLPVISALPVFFWVQTIWQAAAGLGFSAQFLILGLTAILTLFVVAQIWEHVRAGWRVPVGVVAASLLLFGVARHNARFDNNHPRRDHLLYAIDLESKSFRWVSWDDELDHWNGRIIRPPQKADLRSFFGGQEFPVFTSPAPEVHYRGTALSLRGMEGNSLMFHMRPDSGVAAVRMDFFTEAAIQAAEVNGKPLRVKTDNDPAPGQARFTLVYFNPPAQGASVVLKLAQPQRMGATVVDVRFGTGATPRPPELIASPESPTDCVLVRQSFQFDLNSLHGGT